MHSQSNVARRFWALVDKDGPNGCWIWSRCKRSDEYGRFSVGTRKWVLRYGLIQRSKTHRIAYALTFGPIPDGMDVLHHCDNPPCCNPNHLFLGTDVDNVRDKLDKGRENPQCGSDNGSSKLNEVIVLQLRRRYATGRYSVTQLVAWLMATHQLKIHGSTIKGVLRGKRWRHVGGPIATKNRIKKITNRMVRYAREQYATRLFTPREIAATMTELFGVPIRSASVNMMVSNERYWKDAGGPITKKGQGRGRMHWTRGKVYGFLG